MTNEEWQIAVSSAVEKAVSPMWQGLNAVSNRVVPLLIDSCLSAHNLLLQMALLFEDYGLIRSKYRRSRKYNRRAHSRKLKRG